MASRTLTAADNLTDCPDTALTLGAGGITLDCGGVGISGDDTAYGIDLDGYDGNTIENCVIYNFEEGIHLSSGSNDNILSANTIYNTSDYGIYVQSSTYDQILNSDISDNTGFGVYIISNVETSDHVIRGNTINSNTNQGVYLSGEDNVTIDDNTIKYNSHGVYLTNSYLNLITGNTIENNTQDGISMDTYSYNNTLNSNRVCYNLGIAPPPPQTDIHNEGDNNIGDSNTCDTAYLWNDTGTVNCTHVCSWTAPAEEENSGGSNYVQDLGPVTGEGSFTTHRGVTMHLEFEGEEYSMSVDTFSSDYLEVTIMIEGKKYTIGLGESLDIDLDGDGASDITVTFEGMTTNTARPDIKLKMEKYSQASTSQPVATYMWKRLLNKNPTTELIGEEVDVVEEELMQEDNAAERMIKKAKIEWERPIKKGLLASGIMMMVISLLGVVALGGHALRKKR